MNRTFSNLALALLLCGAASAATINTKLSVTNATVSLGVSASLSNGQVTLTNIGSGTMAAPSLTANAQGNYSGAFTITLTGGGGSGTITGTLNIPASAIAAAATGGQITGSATVSGGTYSGGVTGGSFPSLTGTGSIGLAGISLSFSGDGTVITGTGGGGGTPVPTITAVQDAASNTPNIAQGSIFVVKGSNMSPAGPLTQFAPPRPQVSNGIKVTFTPLTGGAGTDAYLVYLYNQGGLNQIACILPSTVAVGSYNVTVTNGTVSAPVVTQVVANKIGLFTQDSTGSGLAIVQNYISASVVDLNRLTTGSVSGTTISPAKPGQPVIAYGTGLGAYAAGDNSASPFFDFRSSLDIKAVVGGVTIPVDYAGRAGYAGEDQINFTLPTNIPTGCAVTLQISVNGKLSAPTSIAIAPDTNSSACVLPGYSTAQLQRLDQGESITTGAFTITQFSITSPGTGPGSGTFKSSSIGGGFSQLTAYQLSSAAQGNVSLIQSGSCQVIQSTTTGSTPSTGGGRLTYLDAGAVTITGPSGSSLTNQALTRTNNLYSLTNIEGFAIPGQTNFTLPAGTYTLNGAGGNEVSSFSNVSMSLASPLVVTDGLPTTVVRSTPLTINWTGGNASDVVEIVGSTSTTSGTGSSAVTSSATFICLTTAGQRTFTVPASILGQMYATTATSPGLLEVASGNLATTFSPSLKSDGSAIPSVFGSFLGIGATSAFQ